MATTIITKFGSGAPTASDVVRGELAVDTENGRLYTEDSGGSVIEIGLNPSGNVDVTGTVTADGLTVSNSSLQVKLEEADGTYNPRLVTYFDSSGTHLQHTWSSGAANLIFEAGGSEGSGTERMRINGDTGDISFYEDTGTTAKFFWDASAESLLLGTDSGDAFNGEALLRMQGATSTYLQMKSATTGTTGILFGDTDDDYTGALLYSAADDALVFTTNNGNERLRIDSSGNVGIGGITPTGLLTLGTGTFSAAAANTSALYTSTTAGLVAVADGFLLVDRAGADVFKVDTDGNLLVGKTATNFASDGVQLFNDGFMHVTATQAVANSGTVASIRRSSTDGSLVDFYKDGGSVGSIGAYSNGLFIGSPAGTDAYIGFTNSIVYPSTSAGVGRDAAIDLGSSSSRFKDLYRSGSTISTSDRNMKQDERDLTEAETRVAQACKGLLKAFRFIDAVEVDGDDARIHFGIIAQDLQAAFKAEGLDATKYAMFRPSTYTDDEGNEQTRLGVCYENLLAFIIAAI